MNIDGVRPAIVSCALAGLFTACTIGPDYERPPLSTPDLFRSQAPGTETASLADLPWWQAFGDPTLRELIQEAIGSNYDVRIAAARVQQARAQARIARAAYFPSIGYTGKVQRSKEFEAFLGISGDQIENRANNLFLGALSAAWEIDIWGGVRRANEAAAAELMATEEGRRAVLLSLVSDVAQNYFELIALDASLDISKKTAAAYQGISKIFQDRLEFGVVSQLQTSRAEGAWAAAAATVPQVETQIASKENQISVLLGRNPGPIARGAPLFAQTVVPTVPAGLPSALLERRPDLLQAEQQLRAANAQIGVAKADFFPKLSLTGMLGKASPELSAITAGSSTIWAIAAGLTGPIFQGGRIYFNYKATEAVWEQARLQYEQAVIRAFQDVASNLDALDKLARAESEQARAVAALERSVQHATDRYLYGFASYFEVLEAEERLFSVQNAQVSTRANRLLAYVELYKALGGGWNVSDPATPPASAPRAACNSRSC